MRALALIGLAHAFQADVAVKNLLLQRAIQGQLATYRCMNDGFRGHWLGRFQSNHGLYDASNGDLHAIDALRVDGDDNDDACHFVIDGRDGWCDTDDQRWHRYLTRMLAAEPEEHVITRPKLVGGSRNNPYLDRGDADEVYRELVEPRAVASALMRTREALAAEWACDARALRIHTYDTISALS